MCIQQIEVDTTYVLKYVRLVNTIMVTQYFCRTIDSAVFHMCTQKRFSLPLPIFSAFENCLGNSTVLFSMCVYLSVLRSDCRQSRMVTLIR